MRISEQTQTRSYLTLLLLSAASLTFEINLTRLFSVAQFYHFAFMIVSLALLGFGASGTALAVYPNLGRANPRQSLAWLALGCALSSLGAYLLVNCMPFDSFSIAWDSRQAGILLLHYLALALPFFFCGMAVGLLLAAYPQSAGRTYAANMLGSALGCSVALLSPSKLGGEGTVVLSSGLAALAAAVSFTSGKGTEKPLYQVQKWLFAGLCSGVLLFSAMDCASRLSGRTIFSFLDLRLSPYKSLSYAMQYPGARLISQRWNSTSRVDVVHSAGIRSLPGLSYRYLKVPPAEDGLLVDGDDLSPVVLPEANREFSAYLPGFLAYQLRPHADTLILEPRGGLDILTALQGNAQQIVAVEMNPLIVQAANSIYQQPRVSLVIDADRSYLRRSLERFDVVVLSLASSYHPIRSGAYSLAEDYRYTVEAFQDALTHLKPDGLLVVSRWLQTPPSECLRTFALAVTSLEQTGHSPAEHIVAYRGYNMLTIVVKNDVFTSQELTTVREFATSRAFDLVYAPGLRSEETNKYNILPESVYYQAFTTLLHTIPHQAFYAAYPFDVRPPTDDHPFFGHYFKWSQTRELVAEMGKTWQPFGGAGYFVILALLLLALGLSALLVLLPAAASHLRQAQHKTPAADGRVYLCLLYFAWIGFAYLLVEIPLIQRFILYLGHPAYAMTGVLFSLLLFSGLGSRFMASIPLRHGLVILVVVLLVLPLLFPVLFNLSLGYPLAVRLFLTVLALAPVGFLMGTPFPGGIVWLLPIERRSELAPWAWGVNGAASVVSAVLAALLALSFGFSWVLRIGALCYAAAWLTVMAIRQAPRFPPPDR
jgi:hypothetical protein